MRNELLIKDERGAVLPIVAFFLAFIAFGIAALVIDAGFLYAERRELVTAADAAALAGAKEMQRYGSTEIDVRSIVKSVAISNGVVYIDDDDIDVDYANSTMNSKVKVRVYNTVELFFAKFFTNDTSIVRASAVARPMRLNPGIFPIGLDETKAYGTDGKPKEGLIYLHGDKKDPNSFADLLNLDGKLNGTSDINNLIVTRDRIIGNNFAKKLELDGKILDAGGWKTISIGKDETIKVLLRNAYKYSDSPKLRQAYMTALAPVYTYVDKDGAYIKEFAEIVILDQIFVQSKDEGHTGLDNAFSYDINSNPIDVNYNNIVAQPIIYPKQEVQNGTDLVVAYFTGVTVSVKDLLNGNYSGTIYDQVELNAVSLVE